MVMISLDIFCDVIDNYGDAGVCLHLARTMSHKDFKVRLFCNNMSVLERICNEHDYHNENLSFENWEHPLEHYEAAICVINAFGCHFDKPTHDTLLNNPQALIIHLEYLSAEDWVEDCHSLPSFVDGLTTHYFFPGFTSKTGGLNIDKELTDKCIPHLKELYTKLTCPQACNEAKTKSLSTNELCTKLNANAEATRFISLFGYKNKAVGNIVKNLADCGKHTHIKVFEGLSLDNINALYQWDLNVGQSQKVGNDLTIEAVDMVGHDKYDDILVSTDINLVRGEDSIVRAMHTGNPFLWHIYPQDEEAHIIKLKSFLERMRTILKVEIPSLEADHAQNSQESLNHGLKFIAIDASTADVMVDEISQVMIAYNEAAPWPDDFDFNSFVERNAAAFYNLAVYLNGRTNLSESLCEFIKNSLGSKLA